MHFFVFSPVCKDFGKVVSVADWNISILVLVLELVLVLVDTS
jgi:hypothetical protein